MATSLGEHRTVGLTQFSAGREGLKLQLDGSNDHGPTHMVLDRHEARWLGWKLLVWSERGEKR